MLARATVRITERRLLLAGEEFEREWTPELHIKLERVSDKQAASSSPILPNSRAPADDADRFMRSINHGYVVVYRIRNRNRFDW